MTARIGRKMPAAEPLPSSVWRRQLERLAYWMLMAVLGLMVWPTLIWLVMR